jgi:hypothetical protein
MLYETTIVIQAVLATVLSPLFKALLACIGTLKRAFECILKHIVEPAAKRIKSGTSFLAEKISKYCKRCATAFAICGKCCAGVLQKCGGFIAAIPEEFQRLVVAPVAARVTQCASVLGRNIRNCWTLVEMILRERCVRPSEKIVRKHRKLIGVVSALVLSTLASVITYNNVEPPVPDDVPRNATSDNSSDEISSFGKLLQHKSFWAVIAGLCVLSFVLSLIIFAFCPQILAKCRCSRIRERHKHPPAGEHSDGTGVKNPLYEGPGSGTKQQQQQQQQQEEQVQQEQEQEQYQDHGDGRHSANGHAEDDYRWEQEQEQQEQQEQQQRQLQEQEQEQEQQPSMQAKEIHTAKKEAAKAAKEAANQAAKAEKEAAKKAKEDEKKRAKEEKDASKKAKEDEKKRAKEEKDASKKEKEGEKHQMKEEKEASEEGEGR